MRKARSIRNQLICVAAFVIAGLPLQVMASGDNGSAGADSTGTAGTPNNRNPVVLEMLSSVSQASDSEPFQVAARLRIAEGWHVYAGWPGNTGEPTTVQFTTDPERAVIGRASFPHPATWDRDIFDLTAFGYEGELLVVATVEASPAAVGQDLPVTASARWLACREKCVGGTATASISIPVASSAVASADNAIFSSKPVPTELEARQAWLESMTYEADGIWSLRFRATGFKAIDDFIPQWLPGGDCMVDRWSIDPAGPSSWNLDVKLRGSNCLPFAGGFLRATTDGGADADDFVIGAWSDPAKSPWARKDAAQAATPKVAEIGDAEQANPETAGTAGQPRTPSFSWYFLLLAFAGGLLLNVMPCVIPVIIPKLNHLVKTAVKYEDRRERHSMLLRNGLAYTAGILSTMMAFAGLIVALKALDHQVGWGFQFQNPTFLAVMCAVLMLMSLGMLGLFPLQSAGHTDDLKGLRATRKRGVVIESFLTGLLVTFLGTPCTAPLLGPAAGFAFLAGPAQIFAFFGALGIGFALPFLLLALLPGWSAHLSNFRVSERGNKWSHGLAFFLLATMVWLIGVMGGTYGLNAVVSMLWFLLVMTAAAWIYGVRCEHFEADAAAKLEREEQALTRDAAADAQTRLQARNAARRTYTKAVRKNRLLAGGALGVIVILTACMLWNFEDETGVRHEAVATDCPVKWNEWSQDGVDKARSAGNPVFVDATASWCMNCKTNEKLVLDRQETAELFEKYGVVPFKADFSRRDPAIARLIEAHDRVGVPVYLVYPPCSGEPLILPEILTPGMVSDAIEKVGPALPGGCPAN